MHAPPSRCELGHDSWEAWSTTVVLRLTDPEKLTLARVSVERELDAIDAACSRFRPDSELSRLNAGDGRPTPVGDLLLEALELSLHAASVTDGDVDPTVGEALKLAGYDRDWRLLDPPGLMPAADDPGGTDAPRPRPAPAIRASRLSGWRTVKIDRRNGIAQLPKGISLDLGATAKAWAADRGAQAAARAAGCGALLGIGGDIATHGKVPPGGWRIHVTDDHRAGPDAPGQTISIRDGGLATSSTTVRRWRHKGADMHHIIDPRSGEPASASWRTVSVAAASCAEANIAATAAIVRGQRAARWLCELGLPSRLVDREGRTVALAGWPEEDS
jgi:thiamine biosynthesis lipoprotein